MLGYATSVKANPNVILVPTNYSTIQEAINHATQGDTILVLPGTYPEHLTIDKSVSLIGKDKSSTIIDGEETGNVIHIVANNVYIDNLTIQGSGKGLYDSGIFIDYSSSTNINYNTIANSSNGICLFHSSSTTLLDNTVSDNKYGISIYSSSNNLIHGNNVQSNKYGIVLYSSNDNKIQSNNASSNKIEGIYLNSSVSNLISDNIISLNSYEGIRIDFSSNNQISDNIISNNDYGIRLFTSNINLVSSNTAISNYYGIYLQSSNNNTIYHNNFNNTDQVWSDSINTWDDNTAEGNYWSDYAGQDMNRDGIGDTSYVINVENKDNHPLMGKFSNHFIVWKDETYHTTTICNSTISNFGLEVGKETGNKIMSFDVTGEDGTNGFCRIVIPRDLMNYSYIVLVDEEEVIPTLLDVSDLMHAYLYFTYSHSSHTITIISSKLLYLYTKLLEDYANLQTEANNLNLRLDELQVNYSILLGYYDRLLENFSALNVSYQQDMLDYYETLENFYALNTSYQQHLLEYYEQQRIQTYLLLEQVQNFRNLTYAFIATTAIFVVAVVYLSTHAHRKVSRS